MSTAVSEQLSSSVEIRFDPRTILVIIVTISVVFFLGGYGGIMIGVRAVLAVVPFVLLLLVRRYEIAGIYVLAFFALLFIERGVAVQLSGGIGFILLVICGSLTRILPGVATFYYFFSTTTVSQLVAAFQRMKLSEKIIIPLSVMFRFFPSVREEASAINDAMRMRGIRLGGKKIGSTLEYRLVPLMISSVRIGEELSASALTRGLGAPIVRTNMCSLGFSFQDGVIFSLCFLALVCFGLDMSGVFSEVAFL